MLRIAVPGLLLTLQGLGLLQSIAIPGLDWLRIAGPGLGLLTSHSQLLSCDYYLAGLQLLTSLAPGQIVILGQQAQPRAKLLTSPALDKIVILGSNC